MTCVEWLHAVVFQGFVVLVSAALVRTDFVNFDDDSHYAADVRLDESTAAPSWAAGAASGGGSEGDGLSGSLSGGDLSGDGRGGGGAFDMWHPPWHAGARWHSPWHASLALKVLLGCGVVFSVPVAFFAIRIMRVQLVAQQAGGGIQGLRAYVGALRLRASRVLAVHGLLFGTIAVYAQTSPTFTTAMTTIALANPCEASANATYLATYCVRSPRNYGVDYLCSDGGFDAYSSAYDACLAARDYFPVTTRVYAAFGLGLSAIVIALYPHFMALAAREMPGWVRVACSGCVEFTSWLCAALYVGVLMAGKPRTEHPILTLVHDLDILVINILVLAVSAIVAVGAMITRALVYGHDIDVVDARGEEGSLSTAMRNVVRELSIRETRAKGAAAAATAAAAGAVGGGGGDSSSSVAHGGATDEEAAQRAGCAVSPAPVGSRFATGSPFGTGSRFGTIWWSPAAAPAAAPEGVTASSSAFASSVSGSAPAAAAFAPASSSAHAAASASVSSPTNSSTNCPPVESRFTAETRLLVTGKPLDAALGVNHYMGVDSALVARGMADGVRAIVRELTQHGTDEDRECLDYVLRQRAGSSPLTFQGGKRRDEHRKGDETLATFASLPQARVAELGVAHVLALRLYTTACYKSINEPLRERRARHPLPVLVNLIKDAIGRLRAVAASQSAHDGPLDLWRGLRGLDVDASFLRDGGTELAPMSTTTELSVALEYARSDCSLLLKLRTESFMQRGADLDFLSCFPGEHEVLFPPLTYLKPTGKSMQISFAEHGVAFRVVEVVPMF